MMLNTLSTTSRLRLNRLDRTSEEQVLEAFTQVTHQCQAMAAFDPRGERSLSQDDDETAARTELKAVLKAMKSSVDSHLLLLRIHEQTYLHLTEGHGSDYRLPITPFTDIGSADVSVDDSDYVWV